MTKAAVQSFDRHSALAFIVALGVVSLFADMAYEGMRGISGPFLGLLGASAGIVGFVAGLGELAGYQADDPTGPVLATAHDRVLA